MKSISLILSCFCIILCTVLRAEAQGWQGILPLHTTRVDVERLLGPPTEQIGKFSVIYKLQNEVVVIDYASGRPCNNLGGWQVPRDTVITITVSPKIKLQLSQLNIEESEYKRTVNIDRPESIKYTNEDKGESIDVYQGDVTSINYFPAAKDNQLRCPRANVELPNIDNGYDYHSLDVYSNISFSDEKARLDNFAIHLQQEIEAKGYIIVYAGRRAGVGEARARAERAKSYLVNVRGIEVGRIVTIDGGHREKLTVELYLIPRDLPAPSVSPTIDPSEVQIIKNEKVRANKRRSSRSRRKPCQ